MRVFHSLSDLPSKVQHAAIALGNFDGVHLGHQAVIAETKRIAHELGVPAAVLTFAPHPREFFSPGHGPLSIYPLATKLKLLEEAGVDITYIAPFNAAFSQLPAEEFIRHVLVRQLGARHVVTGENFVFGKGRGGNVQLLRAKAAEHGFGATQLPGTMKAGAPVSSSRIREHLSRGEMAEASALLGRPYAISGRVMRGDQRGRTLGFPTANIAVSHIFQPKHGIYAVRGTINPHSHPLPYREREASASERVRVQLKGAASLGIRPMFSVKEPLLEAHWFDFSGDLYEKHVEVQLVEYIRPEQNFPDTEALKARIAQDCAKAAEIL